MDPTASLLHCIPGAAWSFGPWEISFKKEQLILPTEHELHGGRDCCLCMCAPYALMMTMPGMENVFN